MSSIDNIVSVSITVARRTTAPIAIRAVSLPPPPTIVHFVQDNPSGGAVQIDTTTHAVQMTTG